MAHNTDIGGDGKLFVGEDKTFRMELLNSASVPVNMAGWDLLFDVRKTDKATVAIFSKPAVLIGVFNASRGLNTQRAVVSVSDTEMNTVAAKTYRFSFKRMDDGSETVLAYGNFIVEKATAP